MTDVSSVASLIVGVLVVLADNWWTDWSVAIFSILIRFVDWLLERRRLPSFLRECVFCAHYLWVLWLLWGPVWLGCCFVGLVVLLVVLLVDVDELLVLEVLEVLLIQEIRRGTSVFLIDPGGSEEEERKKR